MAASGTSLLEFIDDDSAADISSRMNCEACRAVLYVPIQPGCTMDTSQCKLDNDQTHSAKATFSRQRKAMFFNGHISYIKPTELHFQKKKTELISGCQTITDCKRFLPSY